MPSSLKGVIPPVPTIVDDRGRFDEEGMAMLLDRIIASGVHGMLITGSGGEFSHMSVEMRKQVIAFAVRHTNGRLPVMAGIGMPGTQEVLELGRHAEAVGADAVLVVNPYYALLSEEALYQHYRTIAGALRVPVYLYNFPALTGQDLSVQMIKRLALDFETIAGLKDTVDCKSHTRQVIVEVKSQRPDFKVFAGYDEYMLDTLILGGDGGIPASANFAPEICCGIYEAFQNRDVETIIALERRLAHLSAIVALDAPFFGLLKEAVRLTGSPDLSTAVLAPALHPTEEKKAILVDLLKRAGLSPAR
ncbi:dihydrodipicolinate synthase family protein [Consotaella aegiceratis]|uniref:dihydrodipicolinate synthase family protein n=1 Tax=Consotaella aegiceratis TaxID=3097961 RepID=UPI002F41FEA9